MTQRLHPPTASPLMATGIVTAGVVVFVVVVVSDACSAPHVVG